MMALFLVVGKSMRKENHQKLQLWRSRVHLRIKNCHSEGSAVVQTITPRESGSAHGFVFQGTAGEDGEAAQVGT